MPGGTLIDAGKTDDSLDPGSVSWEGSRSQGHVSSLVQGSISCRSGGLLGGIQGPVSGQVQREGQMEQWEI